MTLPESEVLAEEQRAREILRALGGVLVALSGGVDSSVLVALASQELGQKAVAVTVVSAVYARRETEAAQAVARQLGVRHILLPIDHLSQIPRFSANPPDRCYICKRFLFQRLQEMAREQGLTVVHGEQADDYAENRPGQRAAAELGVRAPLAEAGMTKAHVRSLARRMGLPMADAPPMACLATRFAHGTLLTAENLARVEKAEEILGELGLSIYRARYHGDLVRVEVAPSEISKLVTDDVRSRLVAEMRLLGFRHVTVDLSGYHSGPSKEIGVETPATGQTQ
jgi:uncharacterized protein